MNRVLVDSNVLVDVLLDAPDWSQWSAERISDAKAGSELVINPLIYAEICVGFTSSAAVDGFVRDDFVREDLPWEAAFPAAEAFLRYRRAGGSKTSPLPDFYIGAHALVKGYALLTRDARRYKTYFPKLKLIAP